MDLELRLDQILTELELKKKTVISELKDSPDGRIMRTRSHQRPLILQVIGHGDDRKRVCITKDRVLQQKLARKDILCSELEVLELQSNALKGAIEQISRNGRFDRMRFAIENFGWLSDEELQECCFPAAQSGWASEPYDKLDYRTEDLRNMTSFGLRVRSKSELLIAEALHRHGLQFRYEQVYTVDNYTVSADFTIMRADGKLFIWEHEGLMNRQQYARRQRQKAEIFEMLGFHPWDNMIVTYDTGDGNVDLRIIESEIRNKLLI